MAGRIDRASIAAESHLASVMNRLHRLSSALLLSLLLVGMQLGANVHAIEHFGDALRQTADQSLGAQHLEQCAICALFAGGSNAAAGAADVPAPAPPSASRLVFAPLSFAAPAPSYYSTRAPPSLV